MGDVRAVPLLLLAGILTGCANLSGTDKQAVDSGPDFGNPPIVSDRFLLTPDLQVIGELQVIEARHSDTFVDIARTYNLGYDELIEANPGVDPWLPGAGTRILLPTRFVLPDAQREGIVINIASKRLYYFLPPDEDGALAVLTHPIGIGREGAETPLGETTVTAKGRDPVWFPTASIRREYAAEGNPLPAQVPPGPDNPLGRHVLKLGMPSYLIHGTNRPAGVGMRVSHGCVRLFPENIEHLYSLAPVGTKVTIVNQPYLLAWDNGQLLLEAHAPLVDDDNDRYAELLEQLEQAAADSGLAAWVDHARVRDIVELASGMPLPLLETAPAPEAALAGALLVNNLVAYEQTDEAH